MQYLAYMAGFELCHLRYFVQLADERTMTSAAETLHVAQPARAEGRHLD
jgi:hypothetical protein